MSRDEAERGLHRAPPSSLATGRVERGPPTLEPALGGSLELIGIFAPGRPAPRTRSSAPAIGLALAGALAACTTPPDVVSLPAGLEGAGTLLLLAGDVPEALVVDLSAGWTRPAAELVDLWIYRPVPASLGLSPGPVTLGARSAPAPDAIWRWSGGWEEAADARPLRVADCPTGTGRPDGFCAIAACPAGSHDDGGGLCVRAGCAAGFVREGEACRAVCGDGVAVADETCDDGNRVDGDGCSAGCRVESPCDPPARLTVAHVDARARPPGTGTPACPFATIGAALASTATVVVVHPGTYRGERFPLAVRGVTLRGTDRARVIVSGFGPASLDLQGWGFTNTAVAALLLGHADGRSSRVEDLTLALESPPGDGLWAHAVVCDRGSSPEAFGADFRPTAELLRVTVSGYDVGVRVTSHPANRVLGDCSLSVRDSTIVGAEYGIWSAPDPPRYPALLGLEVLGVDLRDNRTGVAIWDRSARAIVARSRFARGEVGLNASLHIDAGGHEARIDVLDNTFEGMARYGLEVVRAAPIARLEGNELRNIRAPNGGLPAIALVIDERQEPSDGSPRIARARRNRFYSNDIAIDLVGDVPDRFGDPVHDFGRPDDPGDNELRCSQVADLRLSSARGLGRVRLVGNVWDHAPPAEGDDVLWPSDRAALPNVELDDARTSTTPCPP